MLVEIENLKIAFQTRTSRFEAVRGVSMKLGTEKLGIVGESGSGKSLTARALMKLLPSNADIRADKLSFDGIDVLSASEKQMRQMRGKRAGFILQDPKYSLNPVKTMGAQIAEAWRAHKGGSKRAAMEAAIALLDQVKIRNPRQVASSYAHEVSGGMGQRVMIAMMLAPDPELLIADEPTSALDVSVQARVLDLFARLQAELGFACLFISHDLAVVDLLAHRIAVLHRGVLVEEGTGDEVLGAPKHPYTQRLLASLPVPDPIEQAARRETWRNLRAHG